MFGSNLICILLILLIKLISPSNADRKEWLFTSNIFDPSNWEDGIVQRDCSGLVFAKENSVHIPIQQIKVKSVTLPSWGEFLFDDNSEIVLDETSASPLNCVKLKPLNTKLWVDVLGWNNTNDPHNPAIPYNERIPSKFDDIKLPTSLHAQTLFIQANVKSFSIGKFDFSNVEFSDYDGKMSWLVLESRNCEDITGCANEVDEYFYREHCLSALQDVVSQNCENPILPNGFCNMSRCGAAIVIGDLKPGFALQTIRQKLRDYASYTYANKLPKKRQVQIVFAEKSFTGQSVVEATEFYNILLGDSSYYAGDVSLLVSGAPLTDKNLHLKHAIFMVFGTLFAALAMFGILFLTHSDSFDRFAIRNRLFGNRPLSTYVLRYDNIEDRSYIASVVDLNSSFENPMYDQPPSRSTSSETLNSVKQDNNEDESLIQNAEEAQELQVIQPQIDVESVQDEMLLKDI